MQTAGKSRSLPILIGAAILGIVMGYVVRGGGGAAKPTANDVTTREKANFDEIRTKMEALGKATAGTPDAAKLHKELAGLIAEQEKLAARTGVDLTFAEGEVTRLKNEMLEQKGAVTGADFWLAPNESITVKDRDTVLALLGIRGGGALADINFAGKPQSLKPGGFVEFQSGGETCKVIYKVATLRSDGRIGFDLVCGAATTVK